VIGEEDGVKKGVLAAEGIWKWRLFDFLQNKNHDIFEEVLGKTIQYLTLKEDKRRFRISLDKNIFNENEPIILDAEEIVRVKNFLLYLIERLELIV